MSWVAVAIGGGAALSTGIGIGRARKADKERGRQQERLDALLKQDLPKFKRTNELGQFYSQAATEALNPQGFTGAETAAFNQNLGTLQNTQMQNAINRAGGQTGRFIGGVLNTQGINALNQFAVNDAQLARQNRMAALGRQGNAISQFQNIENQNAAAEIQRRLLTEQMLGGAIAQQKQNIDNAWKSVGDLGALATGYGLSGALGGAGGGGTNPNALKARTRFTPPTDFGDDINYVDPTLYQ